MPTPHQILGVAEDASEEEIRKAFKKQSMRVHPDLNPDDPDAERKFKEVKKAHDDAMERRKGGSRPAQRPSPAQQAQQQARAREQAKRNNEWLRKRFQERQAKAAKDKAKLSAAKWAARRAALGAFAKGAAAAGARAVGGVVTRCPLLAGAAVLGVGIGAGAAAAELWWKHARTAGAARRARQKAAAAARAKSGVKKPPAQKAGTKPSAKRPAAAKPPAAKPRATKWVDYRDALGDGQNYKVGYDARGKEVARVRKK